MWCGIGSFLQRIKSNVYFSLACIVPKVHQIFDFEDLNCPPQLEFWTDTVIVMQIVCGWLLPHTCIYQLQSIHFWMKGYLQSRFVHCVLFYFLYILKICHFWIILPRTTYFYRTSGYAKSDNDAEFLIKMVEWLSKKVWSLLFI